jgi:hypothetical protein
MALNPQGHWTWTCHACGWSLTNTNDVGGVCQECGTKARCEALGGHDNFGTTDGSCSNGCGYNLNTRTTDLTKRRPGY